MHDARGKGKATPTRRQAEKQQRKQYTEDKKKTLASWNPTLLTKEKFVYEHRLPQ